LTTYPEPWQYAFAGKALNRSWMNSLDKAEHQQALKDYRRTVADDSFSREIFRNNELG